MLCRVTFPTPAPGFHGLGAMWLSATTICTVRCPLIRHAARLSVAALFSFLQCNDIFVLGVLDECRGDDVLRLAYLGRVDRVWAYAQAILRFLLLDALSIDHLRVAPLADKGISYDTDCCIERHSYALDHGRSDLRRDHVIWVLFVFVCGGYALLSEEHHLEW